MKIFDCFRRKPFYKVTSLESLFDKAVMRSEIARDNFSEFEEKDLFYYLFENVFYDKEIITKIQKEYLQFVPKNSTKSFLDVGCGRGEFLTILRDNGIKAKGIEINSVEYKLLKKKGFDVEFTDALTFLKHTEEMFSGISAIEVVEHLTFDYLYEFIHQAYEHVENSGVIILETLNCMNISNLKNFYTDLTHQKPITLETLQFLCEHTGFKNLRVCRSLPHKHGYINYALIGEK
ncbi:MAG: class I SAM-dependent methyltransferase [Brachyspira sp.]|nr:class I SAM-dependent methyltransferase [Brachyspira sp.]